MKKFDREEEDNMMQFSWTGMFAVTSGCSFLFSIFLYLIDGENTPLFLSIGVVTSVCTYIAYLLKNYNRKMRHKRSINRKSIFD